MTKAEIISKIEATTGVSKKECSIVVEASTDVVKGSLIEKENVYLRGFGSFIVKRRAAKTARNIQKNTTVIIDAHDYPGFKPAKSFIEKMRDE